MQKSKFSEEPIVRILKEAGTKVVETASSSAAQARQPPCRDTARSANAAAASQILCVDVWQALVQCPELHALRNAGKGP